MPHTLLYGGTFDPVHLGHLAVCGRAREILAADRVLFIPARLSPHKFAARTTTSGEDRLAMIRLAIAPTPQFAVDDRELHRSGPSYSIDTLEQLCREQPGEHWTMLFGSDQLAKLHLWRRIGDLLALPLDLAIYPRSDPMEIAARLANLAQKLGPKVARRLRAGLLNTPRIDISATQIRERIARNLPMTDLVPPAVADYICAHGLYR